MPGQPKGDILDEVTYFEMYIWDLRLTWISDRFASIIILQSPDLYLPCKTHLFVMKKKWNITEKKVWSHPYNFFPGKYAMAELVKKLPSETKTADFAVSSDTITAVQATIYEVIKENSDFAQ